MKDRHRGHTPELVDPVAKIERCEACGATKRHGECARCSVEAVPELRG
jgi:recombinational DNA repair protein RecR